MSYLRDLQTLFLSLKFLLEKYLKEDQSEGLGTVETLVLLLVILKEMQHNTANLRPCCRRDPINISPKRELENTQGHTCAVLHQQTHKHRNKYTKTSVRPLVYDMEMFLSFKIRK